MDDVPPDAPPKPPNVAVPLLPNVDAPAELEAPKVGAVDVLVVAPNAGAEVLEAPKVGAVAVPPKVEVLEPPNAEDGPNELAVPNPDVVVVVVPNPFEALLAAPNGLDDAAPNAGVGPDEPCPKLNVDDAAVVVAALCAPKLKPVLAAAGLDWLNVNTDD